MAERIKKGKLNQYNLLLDACFAVGPVFLAAAEQLDGVGNFVHILTRAKKNIVAIIEEGLLTSMIIK